MVANRAHTLSTYFGNVWKTKVKDHADPMVTDRRLLEANVTVVSFILNNLLYFSYTFEGICEASL